MKCVKTPEGVEIASGAGRGGGKAEGEKRREKRSGSGSGRPGLIGGEEEDQRSALLGSEGRRWSRGPHLIGTQIVQHGGPAEVVSPLIESAVWNLVDRADGAEGRAAGGWLMDSVGGGFNGGRGRPGSLSRRCSV
ncbi:hypothetical protein EJ06DRAFT_64110 [Trichodelitschia bisporula]|uniref:Uncharacterized protein n=1 Tax=Trichodelitschia bisporula TaxID=703511 RepID=A0A6G1HTA2_9PEZI|nr:hypothetical protein EJ06DRAFT_64110 [Trichodelitschia bisporula]